MSQFKKYFVLEPDYLKRILTTGSSALDGILLKIIRNKKLDPTTKWLMYAKAIKQSKPSKIVPMPKRKKTVSPPPVAAVTTVPVVADVVKKEKQHAKTQTSSVDKSNVETQTQEEQVFETEKRFFDLRDQSLEAWMHQLAQEEAEQTDPRQIVLRESSKYHPKYRIYDDQDSGATLTVDIEEAKEKLDEARQSTPKKKKGFPISWSTFKKKRYK